MKHENIIFGVLLMGIGLFLSYDSSLLYYYYNYTDINFIYMFPTYELCARFILGLLFISNGVLFLLKNNIAYEFLKVIGWTMIIYGVARFIINIEFWDVEIFICFLYIVPGLFFIEIAKKNKFKVIQE